MYEVTSHYPYGKDNLSKLMTEKEIPTKEEYVEAARKDATYKLTRFGVLNSSGDPFNGTGTMEINHEPDEDLLEQYGHDYDLLYDKPSMRKEINKFNRARMKIVKSLSKSIEVPERIKTKVDAKSMDTLVELRNGILESETLLREAKRMLKWFPESSNEPQDIVLDDETKAEVRRTIHGMCKLNDIARNNFEI